jgi:branched-subunit amino acid ABC-type transport system permease component
VTLFFSYALSGVPAGCSYALVAVGLVLTYRATGVFNFGFAAEAFGAGVIYAELISHGVNPGLAFAIVVVVIAPAFGAMLDYLFFSRVPPGDQTAKTLMSIGLLVALPQIVLLIVGSNEVFQPPTPSLPWKYWRFWEVSYTNYEVFEMLVTGLLLVLLILLLRTRSWGLPTRASVESPKLLELNGVNSKWVIRSSWMLSTSLAAIAGIMIALSSSTVNPTTYSWLLVSAIAAAALGGLRNLPLAVAGGIGIAVVGNIITGYLPSDSVWFNAFVPSLPFFMLLVLLVVNPSLRNLDVSADPMATVEPPPPPPALALRPPSVNRVLRRYRWPFLVAVILLILTFCPGTWINALTVGAALSMIFLSITLMTGLAGQLSLAQAAFAGVGAFATAQLNLNLDVPILIAALAGGLVAAVGGCLASLPALRLRGLSVTILTLCFALLADSLLFPTSWIGFSGSTPKLPRPKIFRIDFSGVGSKSFFILTFVVLLAVAGMVHQLLKGTTGRALSAVHASPAGAASSGVAVRRLTIWLFLLAGFIAGIGGAFFAMTFSLVDATNYSWLYGPIFLVIVVTIGAATVEGAIVGGMLYALINQALSYVNAGSGRSLGTGTLTIVLLSVGAFTYANHPEGVGEYLQRRATQLIFRTPRGAPVAAVSGEEST